MKKKFLLCTLVLAVVTAQAAKRPNVVLVITDDQGYGDLSCHGNPILKTPHLDKLHADSVRLTDYHVAPTCSPTRRSRGCARGAGQRFFGLPLCCHSALQGRDPTPPWEPCRA